ncbi:Serine protease, subtilisin family [Micromonospora citrea]|uniref:Serine protease, subtilisin family n=1 Tax=Micromonospora citrea TaxID=47855 RepID=A0A1C6VL45_9ACTN|nr:S8 family serine peptidase [Micromonospora citrea]SCL67049.1 Serine protease, subtilisin family [Micromonospora citrea]
MSRLWTKEAAVGLVVAGTVLLGPAQAAWAAPAWELRAMSVPEAWAVSRGDGVTVAVIDSGIRTGHEALKGRATEGPDMLNENDKDAPYYGRHGTAMASHVLDVAPGAKVLGLRTIRDDGDPKLDERQEGFGQPTGGSEPNDPYALAIAKAVDLDADVISLSLGTDDLALFKRSTAQAAAIAYATSRGIPVVASAGNSGDTGNGVSYPANYPGVIAVAASNKAGARADFSTVHSYVDVAAPGQQVAAADIRGGRSRVSGTSSAGALTAGVVALIKSKYPDLAPRQIEQVLIRTASRYDEGHDPFRGYGLVDAEAALKAAGALKPEPATLPATRYEGPAHFGPGDDGTPLNVNQPLEKGMLALGGGVAVPGVLAILGGVLLLLSGRRARRRAGGAGTGGGG